MCVCVCVYACACTCVPFPFINCHFAYGPHWLSLLYPEAVLCPSGTNIPPSLLSCSLPLLPHPLSPVFVSYSLPFVPLGQINLLCAENLVLGVLGWNPCLPLHKLGNFICPPSPNSTHAEKTPPPTWKNPELIQSPEVGAEDPWVWGRYFWLKLRGVYKFKWGPKKKKSSF